MNNDTLRHAQLQPSRVSNNNKIHILLPCTIGVSRSIIEPIEKFRELSSWYVLLYVADEVSKSEMPTPSPAWKEHLEHAALVFVKVFSYRCTLGLERSSKLCETSSTILNPHFSASASFIRRTSQTEPHVKVLPLKKFQSVAPRICRRAY